MRLDIHLHFPERFYEMANQNLQREIDRATKTITDQAATIADLKTQLAASQAANAGAADAEDEVDASVLKTALDAAGAEPEPVPPTVLALDISGFPTSVALGSPETIALVATGGEAPYTFSATGLPDGLTQTDASVTGAATVAGTFSVSLGVVDGAGNTASANVTVVVA